MDTEEDDLSVGCAEYLSDWGLSESTISNFEENQISLKLLGHIEENELKELIPSLRERILFKRGLNKLQNIIHATDSDDTESNSSAPSTSSTSKELATKEKSIELDFESKFKDSQLLLFKKWPTFMEKSLNHLKMIKAASDYIRLIEENPSEDVRDFCYCAAMLHAKNQSEVRTSHSILNR